PLLRWQRASLNAPRRGDCPAQRAFYCSQSMVTLTQGKSSLHLPDFVFVKTLPSPRSSSFFSKSEPAPSLADAVLSLGAGSFAASCGAGGGVAGAFATSSSDGAGLD